MQRRIYYISAVLITALTAFLSNYIFARKLTVAEYGRFGLLLSSASVIMSIVLCGQTSSFTVSYFSHNKSRGSVYKDFQKSIFLISSLWLLSASLILPYAYNNPVFLDFEIVFFVLAIFCLAVRSFFSNIFVCLDLYKPYLLASIFYLFINCGLLFFFPGILQYFLFVALSTLIFVIIGMISLHKTSFFFPRNYDSGECFSYRELLILGTPTTAGMLVVFVNNYVDRYAISYFMTYGDVGLYTLASTLSVGVGATLINSIIKADIAPLLSALRDNDRNKFNNITNQTVRILLFFTILTYLIYLAFGEAVVQFFFGDIYLPALPYMIFLFFSVVLYGFEQVYGQVLIQKKKQYLLLVSSGFGVVVNAILNFILIPVLGVYGAVFSYLVTAFISFLLCFYFVRINYESIRFPFVFIFSVVGLVVFEFFNSFL